MDLTTHDIFVMDFLILFLFFKPWVFIRVSLLSPSSCSNG